MGHSRRLNYVSKNSSNLLMWTTKKTTKRGVRSKRASSEPLHLIVGTWLFEGRAGCTRRVTFGKPL